MNEEHKIGKHLEEIAQQLETIGNYYHALNVGINNYDPAGMNEGDYPGQWEQPTIMLVDGTHLKPKLNGVDEALLGMQLETYLPYGVLIDFIRDLPSGHHLEPYETVFVPYAQIKSISTPREDYARAKAAEDAVLKPADPST